MSKKIHQLLPTISINDAIGNETIVIQKSLKNLGYESEIFAENIHPSLIGKTKKYTDYTNDADLLIYHHSTGSGLANFISDLTTKKIMIYHNITPPEFFRGVNETIVNITKQGIEQTKMLKDKIDLALGDSEFNRLELEKLGYKKTGVLPILLDLTRYKKQVESDINSKFKNSTNFLYVGRIAPNKRVDEIIRIFAYYYYNINKDSNLFLVGDYGGVSDSYYRQVIEMVKNLKLKNVHYIKGADDLVLSSIYSIADISIMMSDHEGFCVPLVESMFYEIPIVAKNSTAIPYTLGDSGVLVKNENFEEIAEVIDVILNDEELKKTVIEKQTKRFNTIYQKSNEELLNDILKKVL